MSFGDFGTNFDSVLQPGPGRFANDDSDAVVSERSPARRSPR